jgi:hypothetical protein
VVCAAGGGHNPPVGVVFQFLLVGRLAIELNGRYSASKLMTALAQPGHDLSVTRPLNQPFEGLLYLVTCLWINSSKSALVVLVPQARICC